VVPGQVSDTAYSMWVRNPQGHQLVLFTMGSSVAPAARLAGIEGIDVAQLGAVSYRMVDAQNNGCPTFTLRYDERKGAGIQTKVFPCTDVTPGVKAFTPSASVPGNAIVMSLVASYAGPIGMGASVIDDITVAGITATGPGIFRQP
jgi:hypothetical protein